MPRTLRLIGIIIGLALIIGVVINALNDDSRSGGATVLNFSPPATATPVPIAQASRPLLGGASPNSALVMVQGLVDQRLVLWPLNGSTPPQEIDRPVSLWPLLPSLDGSRLLYSTKSAVMVLDIEARRAIIAGELPDNSKVTSAQWSPDGQAIAYAVKTPSESITYYSLANGSRSARLMMRGPSALYPDVTWLADNRPVTVYMGIGPVGGLEARYKLYDPLTGELTDLPSDTRTIQPWSPWRSQDGSQQLFTLTTWENTRRSGACKTGALGLAGEDWVYLTSTAGRAISKDVAFEIKNVFLDRPTWLKDGRVILRGMADEGCAPHASGLYIARLGEEPVQIVETDSYYTTEDNDGLLWGVSFAVSPDQSLVAWVQNDVQTRRSTVYLTPLDGGEVTPLFQTGPPTDSAPFAYQDTEMIFQLVWLP